MSTLPTTAQVHEIAPSIKQTVPAEYIDLNGHMNIQHYLNLGGSGIWLHGQQHWAMDEDYLERTGFSTFTAEHHLRYLAEIVEGSQVSVHVRVEARSERAMHVVALIVDDTADRLACVMEAALVHMDMGARRPTPFPADVADAIDADITAAEALSWPAPVSGSITVRRA